tara:strand:- start:389 stop:715 length:327 start_codon:yes stop_codon:yes gene_type:complete
MDCGLGMIAEDDIVTQLKNSNLPKTEQVKKYMNYLLNDCNYKLPDMFLEFVAREHLDCKYTEEEITKMRGDFHRKQEVIEEQNTMADLKEKEEANNKVIIEEIKNEII